MFPAESLITIFVGLNVCWRGSTLDAVEEEAAGKTTFLAAPCREISRPSAVLITWPGPPSGGFKVITFWGDLIAILLYVTFFFFGLEAPLGFKSLLGLMKELDISERLPSRLRILKLPATCPGRILTGCASPPR